MRLVLYMTGVALAVGYIINNAHKVKLAKTTDANSIQVFVGMRGLGGLCGVLGFRV